jgi:hypothetical protein
MTLTRGEFRGYEPDRMVVIFTMMNDQIEVPCAISSIALDELDGSTNAKHDQREQQFLRLRDRIEQRAAQKFEAVEFEGNPKGLILRSIDFRS